MRPYQIKDITIHNDRQITIGLYEDIQYANGKARCINLISNSKAKSIFDKPQPSLSDTLNLKVDSLIHIDTAQISQNSYSSWISSDSGVVSKVE
jgi:hypothetical protein